MKRNSSYLSKFNKELNIISVRTGVDRKDVEEVLEHFFDCMKNWLKDRRMPIVSIKYFGSFEPQEWKMRAYLRKYFYHYRNGNSPRYKVASAITRVWKIIKRCQQQDQKIKTHRIWDNMDPKKLMYKIEQPQNISDSSLHQKTETNFLECTEEKKSTDK